MTCRGHVKNGVVVLEKPGLLPEGALVNVSLAEEMGAAEEGDINPSVPAIEDELAALWADVPASEWSRVPTDLTDRLDEYIYGAVKKRGPYSLTRCIGWPSYDPAIRGNHRPIVPGASSVGCDKRQRTRSGPNSWRRCVMADR
jgi:hypothetical protein